MKRVAKQQQIKVSQDANSSLYPITPSSPSECSTEVTFVQHSVSPSTVGLLGGLYQHLEVALNTNEYNEVWSNPKLNRGVMMEGASNSHLAQPLANTTDLEPKQPWQMVLLAMCFKTSNEGMFTTLGSSTSYHKTAPTLKEVLPNI